MSKKSKPSVTWFAPASRWKKVIGKTERRDGRLAPRTFYFGSTRETAEAEAAVIKARWRRLKMEGKQAWPPGEPDRLAIQHALGVGAGAPAATIGPAMSAPLSTVAELTSPSSLTIEEVGQLFIEEKLATGISDRWLHDLKGRIRRAVDSMGSSTPIGQIGQSELTAFSKYWNRRDGDDPQARVPSLTYSGHIMAAMKAVLLFASDHDQIRWQKPARFEKLMAVNRRFRTEAEFAEAEKHAWNDKDERHFSIPELKNLWTHADERMRLYMLLGLNCAYYAEDISDLRHAHLHRADGEVFLRNIRRKTTRGRVHIIKRQHLLWPETVALLERLQGDDTAKPLLLSPTGRPVVTSSGYNSTTKAWERLRTKAGLPNAKFYHLRHTSGQDLKQLASEEESETHLAHKSTARMSDVYTDRAWDRHVAAVRKLRKYYSPVIDPQ